MNPADKEIPDSELIELFSGKIVHHETVAYYLDENISVDKGVESVHERIMGLEGLTHAGLVIVKSRTYRDYPAQLASRLYRMADKYEGWADWLHGQLIDL